MLQSSRSIVSATSGRSIRSARPGASRPSLRTQTPGSRSIGRRTSAHTQKREFTQAIAFAKELSSAFWNGSKALYANFRDSRILKQRREAGETLTRPEIRLIDRTNDDLWKLAPLFVLNLLPGSLIILPLYIAAVPGALPSTIKIADWVEKSKKALIEAKATGASNFMNHVKGLVESTPETNDYDHVLTPDIRNKITSLSSKSENKEYVSPSEIVPLSKPFETILDVVEMDAPLLTSSSQLLGLASFRIIPLPFRIARVTKQFARLQSDDKLVLDLPNGVADLTDSELAEFLEERGMSSADLTREQQLQWASDWLSMAKDTSIVPSAYLLFASANAHGNVPAFTPKPESL